MIPLSLSMQRTGTIRFAQLQFERQRRLALAADAGRSVSRSPEAGSLTLFHGTLSLFAER